MKVDGATLHIFLIEGRDETDGDLHRIFFPGLQSSKKNSFPETFFLIVNLYSLPWDSSPSNHHSGTFSNYQVHYVYIYWVHPYPHQFDNKLAVLGCVMHPRYTQLKFKMAPKKGGWKMTAVQGLFFTLGVNMHINVYYFYLKILGSNIIHYLYIFCIFFTHVISFVEIFTYIDISDTFTSVHTYTPGTKNHVASFQRDPQAGIVTDWVMERRGGRGKNHNRGGGCEWQGCVDCTLSKPCCTMEGGPAKIEEVCGQDVLARSDSSPPSRRGLWLAINTRTWLPSDGSSLPQGKENCQKEIGIPQGARRRHERV